MGCELCGATKTKAYISRGGYSFYFGDAEEISFFKAMGLVINGWNYCSMILCDECLEFGKAKEMLERQEVERQDNLRKKDFIKKRNSFMQKYKSHLPR